MKIGSLVRYSRQPHVSASYVSCLEEAWNISIGDIKIPLPPFGQLVFLPSAGLAIISGIMMITRKNAVHSALWLIMAFFNLAVMYVMLGAEFLAALQVLVYTGAILVLFLFVIMLLGLKESTRSLTACTPRNWWPHGPSA